MNCQVKMENLNRDEIFEILENIYNEVYVIDKDMKIIYVNPACSRNYGLLPEDMIGKNHNDFTGDLWYPSVIPSVFEQKRKLSIQQLTYLGKTIVSSANPILDNNGNIEMVICITEEKYNQLDVEYNPISSSIEYYSTLNQKNNDNSSLKNKNQIITVNSNMESILASAISSAKKDISILIHGESGTGKSMFARYIHDNSSRNDGPFISLNCAAIPDTLLESELFGYEPHAFSGANPKGKVGLIETAHGGTLFLDEIAELALPLQAKLLDVIETKSFIPIGGKEVKNVDIRIITATNQSLNELVKNKKFREDLFWRLNVMEFELPPLRNRVDDIPPLIDFFINKSITKKRFSKEAMDILIAYQWPGNIRQLKNVVERAGILSISNQIEIDDLPFNLVNEVKNSDLTNINYNEYIDNCIKNIIKSAYEKFPSSRKMASYLNISQTKANNLIKKYIIKK